MVYPAPPYRTYMIANRKKKYEAAFGCSATNDYALATSKGSKDIHLVRLSHHGEADIDLSDTPDELKLYFICDAVADVIDEFL